MNIAILFNAGGLGDAGMTIPLFFSLVEKFKNQSPTIRIYTHLPHFFKLFKELLSLQIQPVPDLYISSPFQNISILRQNTYDIFINRTKNFQLLD